MSGAASSSAAFDPILLLQKLGGILATGFFDDHSGSRIVSHPGRDTQQKHCPGRRFQAVSGVFGKPPSRRKTRLSPIGYAPTPISRQYHVAEGPLTALSSVLFLNT